ncbi:hypothetical protein ACHAP5_012075 [Fusarium lateritium]
MPGASCTEHFPGSATTLPCLVEQFDPQSIDVEGNCAFYTTPNCEGDSPILNPSSSVTCFTEMEIQSFKCWAE